MGTSGLKRLGIINVVAALAFGFFLLYSYVMLPLKANMRVVDLDREGAIDADKLKHSFPELAENVRARLGCWVAQTSISSTTVVSLIGLVLCVANAAVIFSFVRSSLKASGPIDH